MYFLDPLQSFFSKPLCFAHKVNTCNNYKVDKMRDQRKKQEYCVSECFAVFTELKYDYSFLCQDLQLSYIWFKLWPWSYKPLSQEVAHKGILSAPWKAGWLEGQMGAVLCLPVHTGVEFVHVHECWVYVYSADFIKSDVLVSKQGWFAQLQGIWTPGGPGRSAVPTW